MKVTIRYAASAAVLLLCVGVTTAFAISTRVPKEIPTISGRSNASSIPDAAPAVKQASPIKRATRRAEKDETANLTAKITADEAKSAALAAKGGTAGKVKLEDEDGKAVYGVEVTTTTGARLDVKVDANSGAVVKSDSDDDGDENGKDDEGENEDDG